MDNKKLNDLNNKALSDEELEQVTGGYVQYAEIDDGDLIDISPDLPDIDKPTFDPNSNPTP